MRNPLEGKLLRKKTEKILSEKRRPVRKALSGDREFQAIFELSSVGMTERDALTGRRIRVNQRLCEMTGYSENELLNGKSVKLTHPDDRERNREVREAVLKGESDTWVIEKRYVRKDGEVIWVHVNGNLIRDSRSLPYRTVAVMQDITERKQAEERERKEHEETSLVNRILRLFVEHDGDELFDRALAVVQEGMASKYGVFGYITEPGHLFCPSLSKMLDECEIEGKCIHYPPEKWKGLWARALTEKRSFYTNEAPPVPPGHPIIHNNLAVPVLFQGEAIGLLNLANKEGGYSEEDRKMLDAIATRMAPVLYVWIQRKLRDDERGRAGEALRASEERFRALYEKAPLGIARIDSTTGRFLLINATYCDILQRTAAEVLQLDLQAITHPDDLAPDLENMKRLRDGLCRSFEMDKRYLRPDGSIVWVTLTVVPEWAEGQPPSTHIAMVADITARKHAEEGLRKANEELEIRVRERTEELAKSQERLQLLASQLLLAQEQERKRIANELHDGLLSELAATKYLLEGRVMLLEKGKLTDPGEFKKISDILANAMKEARRIMNNLHPSVLDELGLISAINWWSGEYEKSYLHIKVQKQITVSEQDISDGVRVVIFRVLQEALNNFAKHGKGDRVELSLAKSDGTFALMIQDNGQGFDLENAQKGLGLESMRERVELSGGEFHIQSIIGQGTTIRAIWNNS